MTTKSKPCWLNSTQAKIKKLSLLNPNWNSYGALAPTPAAVQGALVLVYFASDMADIIPEPQVVPTVVGGIQLEWHDPFEFEVECQGHGVYVVPEPMQREPTDFAQAVLKRNHMLYLVGSKPEHFLADLVCQVGFIWRAYAMAEDCELTKDAIQLKQDLLEIALGSNPEKLARSQRDF